MFLYLWSALQIIFEMMPISSSGHLQLIADFLKPDRSILLQEPFNLYIGYLLHIPTAIIVPLFFFRRWSFPFIHIATCWPFIAKISFFTFCADVITVLFYLSFNIPILKTIPLGFGFFLTGGCLLSLLWCPKTPITTWRFDKALMLGAVQGVAFIPGLSRFALTYVAARWQGMSARRSFEISFLIQWPLLVVASLYSLYICFKYNLLQLLNLPFWCVMLIAGIIAYGVLYGMNIMVKHRMLWLWGVYMMIPSIIAILV